MKKDGSFPKLSGCHTQAKTLSQLMERTQEAVRAYISTGKPEISEKFVGIQQIEEIVPGLLNKIVKKDLRITREEFMKFI